MQTPTSFGIAPSIFLPVLHDLGGTNTDNTVTLRLDTKRGPRSITFRGVPHTASPKLYPSRIASQPPPIYLAHIADNFWHDDLGNGTVYVQFNQVIDKANERLRDFGVRLRKHLTEINARTLIVDTRYNGGGDTFEYLELLRTLVAFDAQAGHQLYYVEGRDTFSAAVNFSTDVRRLTKAIFVGEPCSAARATGDPVFITLPNSGIQVKFSTNTWALFYPDDGRRWIPPDMPVTLTATDYFANKTLCSMRSIRR